MYCLYIQLNTIIQSQAQTCSYVYIYINIYPYDILDTIDIQVYIYIYTYILQNLYWYTILFGILYISITPVHRGIYLFRCYNLNYICKIPVACDLTAVLVPISLYNYKIYMYICIYILSIIYQQNLTISSILYMISGIL